MFRGLLLTLAAALCMATPALAINAYSDGSDQALELTGTGETVIDLSQAVTGTWDTPSPTPSQGVYDPDKWAVVFKYSSVNIGAGHTVRFTNHPSAAPVVWLVPGDVTIAGTIALNGEAGLPSGFFAEPGPGGFRGGRAYLSAQSLGSAGFGPGGGEYVPSGSYYGWAGGYGTPGSGTYGGDTYGNARILPLIGGSGGSGDSNQNGGGGAGGGAILIAAGGTINLTGGISARGGNGSSGGGGASGGGIRLIADTVTGEADGLLAYGGNGNPNSGGTGRIRIETNTLTLIGASNPNYTLLVPLESNGAVVWPPEGSPGVRVTTFAGLPVPADPGSEFIPPGDLLVVSEEPVYIEVETTNVPIDWVVEVRVAPRSGDEYVLTATFSSGDETSALWQAETPDPLPVAEFVVVQARAY